MRVEGGRRGTVRGGEGEEEAKTSNKFRFFWVGDEGVGLLSYQTSKQFCGSGEGKECYCLPTSNLFGRLEVMFLLPNQKPSL